MTDYLNKARDKSTDRFATASEVELITGREDISEAWQAINEIREKVAEAKIKALVDIDQAYADALSGAESHYAFLLSLSR